MRIIAQHNLWFRGSPHFNNYRIRGRRMYSVAPKLGLRSSSDRLALRQEMQWLHRYTGRDGKNFVYSLEWVQPDNRADRNIQQPFLAEIERTAARWNIFYDPVLAARRRNISFDDPIDFSQPEVASMFLADLSYLWNNYFQHEQYWRLQGKPVLYVWSTTSGIRNVDAVFTEAQEQGIYLLGDTFGGPLPAPPLDADTGFVAATPELRGSRTTIDSIMPVFEGYFTQPRRVVGGRQVDRIPALSLQYDDTEFQNILKTPATRLLARNRGEIEDFLRLARDHAEPIGGERYVFVGTTNNWAEGSTLLPSRGKRSRYFSHGKSGINRIGNYRFDHLAAVRSVLFPQVRRYKGPRLKRLGNGAVRFTDCDVLGRLTLEGEVNNRPKWKTGEGLVERQNGERIWRPEGPVGLRLELTNLDGKKDRLRIES